MKSSVSVGEARRFGLTVGAVLLALGSWWLYRGRFPIAAPVLAAGGALLVLLGGVAPAALRTPCRLWMRMAEGMSFVMTRVILAIVFYLVVTPIGWLRRALGGDPLRRRGSPSESYWKPYPARQRDPRHYEKMF